MPLTNALDQWLASNKQQTLIDEAKELCATHGINIDFSTLSSIKADDIKYLKDVCANINNDKKRKSDKGTSDEANKKSRDFGNLNGLNQCKKNILKEVAQRLELENCKKKEDYVNAIQAHCNGKIEPLMKLKKCTMAELCDTHGVKHKGKKKEEVIKMLVSKLDDSDYEQDWSDWNDDSDDGGSGDDSDDGGSGDDSDDDSDDDENSVAEV